MTQHNIVGSEAFDSSPHVEIRVGGRRRPLHPAVKLFAITGAVGAVASLIDTVIGAPVCLGIVTVAFIVLWATPTH